MQYIFKKGPILNPDNYSGISIGSCVRKLFSLKILYVKENNSINPNQIRFKKDHRPANHIFVLSTIINKIVKIENFSSIMIDFRKTQDSINKTLLFINLQNIGSIL